MSETNINCLLQKQDGIIQFRELLRQRIEILWPVMPKDNIQSVIDHETFGLSRNPRKSSL